MGANVLNISPLVIWVVALSQLLTFGLTVWNLMASGSRANGRRLDEHAKRLEGIDLRLNGIEQAQRSLPSQDDLHELELAMTSLKGHLETIGERMAGHVGVMNRLEATVARHEDHLLKGGRG